MQKLKIKHSNLIEDFEEEQLAKAAFTQTTEKLAQENQFFSETEKSVQINELLENLQSQLSALQEKRNKLSEELQKVRQSAQQCQQELSVQVNSNILLAQEKHELTLKNVEINQRMELLKQGDPDSAEPVAAALKQGSMLQQRLIANQAQSQVSRSLWNANTSEGSQPQRDVFDMKNIKSPPKTMFANQNRKAQEQHQIAQIAPIKQQTHDQQTEDVGFKRYLAFKKDTNQMIAYNFQSNEIKIFLKETKRVDQSHTFCLQVNDSKIIVSGGWERDQNRFTIIDGEKIQEFYMKYRRGDHRLVFNNKDTIYLTGGYDFQNKKYITSLEKFTLNNQFQELAPAPSSFMGHGAIVFDNRLFSFGGYNGTKIDKIFTYDPARNVWSTHNTKLPTGADGVYTANLKTSICLFDNKYKLEKTLLFDSRILIDHGPEYPGPGLEYMWFHPTVKSDCVFIFDWNIKLYRYTINKAEWSEINTN